MLTEEVFDYIFLGKELDFSKCPIKENILKEMRNSFTYWYPMDLRCSGKDLIGNHLTMSLYNHAAVWNNFNYMNRGYFCNGYITVDKEKMSKSKGNLITANELLEMYDSDTIRFYFTFKGPETNDMSCSLLDITQTHNKFLVGMLGNFVNRNLSFINKKFDGIIKEGKIDEEIITLTKNSFDTISNYFEKSELRNAATAIMDYVSEANKYYDSKQPWILAKENIEEFNNVTYTCTYMIANIANMIAPIMPKGSLKIKKMLNLDDFKFEEVTINGDIKLNEVEILYNRLDETVE
jgi:methionyl-tRNA synthetase